MPFFLVPRREVGRKTELKKGFFPAWETGLTGCSILRFPREMSAALSGRHPRSCQNRLIVIIVEHLVRLKDLFFFKKILLRRIAARGIAGALL